MAPAGPGERLRRMSIADRSRKRAREYGLSFGRFPVGERNAITDVSGVRVGHHTVVTEDHGRSVRTGVTAVWPSETPWLQPVPCGTSILNGFGEILGISQIDELGVLRSPITLAATATLGEAARAATRWLIARQADPIVLPVVAECDDSYLSDVSVEAVKDEHVIAALTEANDGPVAMGAVGAGTGMQCFDFKGGIGSSSRLVPGGDDRPFTLGALVLTNFGVRQDLRIDGVPVGEHLGDLMPQRHSSGSCIVVLATDCPLSPHQLRRLALRGQLGLARAGSTGEHASGELMLAFSTLSRAERGNGRRVLERRVVVHEWYGEQLLNALFAAAVEAVEEAVIDAMFTAGTMVGRNGHVLHGLPLCRTLDILDQHGRLRRRSPDRDDP